MVTEHKNIILNMKQLATSMMIKFQQSYLKTRNQQHYITQEGVTKLNYVP